MFTKDNTEGYSKLCLQQMNIELEEALKDIEYGTEVYWEIEKRVSEEILKKWDAEMCATVDYFFKEVA